MRNYQTIKKVFGCAIVLLLVCWGSAFADQSNPLGDAGVSLIKTDFQKWLAGHNYGNNSNDITVITQAVSTYEFKSLQKIFRFYKILVIRSVGGQEDADAFRVLGTVDAPSGKRRVFWDTGFFMPECGSGAEVSIGEVSLLWLAGKPVVEFESIQRPVICAGESTQVIRKTILFLAEEPYSKVFEIESGFINFHNDIDDKHPGPEYRGAEAYPNACVGMYEESCEYLTVVRGKSFKTYGWDKSFAKLVPLQ